jgi:hypothetical protein
MFKKPFNRSVGETRECKYCGDTFHAKKPIWKCQTCVNAAQKIIEQKKRARTPKKENYPFDNYTNKAFERFCSIRKELRKAWIEFEKTGDRSIITAHYDKQIKEIKENGIMEWILDRRTPEAKRENNPNLRSRNMIAKDLPDTRGHYEY